MPFTKSVTLYLPEERLQDVEIVDTPGTNDPVASREQRTRDLLATCDVVFVVSPAGQFLSAEDLDLMTRIQAKDGVQEFYLIASQVDNQLFGNEKEDAKGRLPDVLENVKNKLIKHAQTVIGEWKVLGSEEIRERMLQLGRERFFCTAAISYGLAQNLEKQNIWDDNEQHVWKRLCQGYPEYFSDGDKVSAKANLDLLTGITPIHEAFADVRSRKSEITEEKIQTYAQTEQRKIDNFSKDLQKSIKDRIGEIQRTNVDELRTQQETMQKNIGKTKDEIDNDYKSLVEDFCAELRQNIDAKHAQLFRQISEGAEGAKGTETESYEAYVGRGGFLWLTKKYETRYREVRTVNAGAIYGQLQSLTGDIQNQLEAEISERVKTWRKQVATSLVRTLRESMGDDNLNISMIQRTLREVFQSVAIPIMEFQDLPNALKQTGLLKNYEADSYMEEVYRFLPDFQKQIRADVKVYLKKLEQTLAKLDCADRFLFNFMAQVEQLAKEIANKEMTIESYQRSLQTLEQLGV